MPESPDISPEDLPLLTLDLHERMAWIFPGRSGDRIMGISKRSETVSWSGEEDQPPFVELGELGQIPLSWTLASWSKTRVGDEITDAYSLSRFEFKWQIPGFAANQWRWFHVRYGYLEVSIEDGSPVSSQAVGEVEDLVYNGEDYVGFDPANVETWPGTGIIAPPPVSSPPNPPAPGEGDPEGMTSNRATLLMLRWLMPLGVPPPPATGAVATYAPGFIPGVFAPYGAPQQVWTGLGWGPI